MIRRAAVGFGVGLAVIAINPGLSAAAGALVWPTDPLVLTATSNAFITSIEVSNLTDVDVTVAAAAQGQGENENACLATIVQGATVPAKRVSTVSLTVVDVPKVCEDPADGAHQLVLLESGGTPVHVSIKKSVAKPEEPKATGIIWPTDPIFLRRRDGNLTGSFTVVNPTEDAISVTPPTFKDSCEQALPVEGKAVTVQPHGAEKVAVTGPKKCTDLSSATIAATASAKTSDGSKSDVAELTIQAEVDWGRFGWFLAISLGVVLSLALCAARLGTSIKLNTPLRIDSTSPTSWLSSIATIGPLLTALASTTGLPEGLFGTGALPQQTLILGAAAISLLLLGVAGLITGIPVAHAVVEGKDQTCPRSWQFAAGAGLSGAAAALQVWAVTTALSRLNLPVLGSVITVGQIVALMAVAVYLCVSVRHYVMTYGKDPDKMAPTASDALVAALTEALVVPQADDDAVVAAGTRANAIAEKIAQSVDDHVARRRAPLGLDARGTFSRNLI